jgi:hypothetical protein
MKVPEKAMKVIKSNTYNIINPEPFEIPYPLVFELLSGNTLLAEYTISDTGVVDYSFNPNAGEKILTSIRRPLSINDIYFLFTSRIFPDKTPYTAMEMERFGIEDYHPYTIIRRTRGMLPGDKYWLRFDGEEINYKAALQEHRNYYENSYKKYMDSLEAVNNGDDAPGVPAEEPDEPASEQETAAFESEAEMMSEDMISSLMSSMSGDLIMEESLAAIDEHEPVIESEPEPEPVIEHEPAIESEPEESEPAAPAEASGGNMSPEAIAAMLAANQ